jgi:hypothetical protein
LRKGRDSETDSSRCDRLKRVLNVVSIPDCYWQHVAVDFNVLATSLIDSLSGSIQDSACYSKNRGTHALVGYRVNWAKNLVEWAKELGDGTTDKRPALKIPARETMITNRYTDYFVCSTSCCSRIPLGEQAYD